MTDENAKSSEDFQTVLGIIDHYLEGLTTQGAPDLDITRRQLESIRDRLTEVGDITSPKGRALRAELDAIEGCCPALNTAFLAGCYADTLRILASQKERLHRLEGERPLTQTEEEVKVKVQHSLPKFRHLLRTVWQGKRRRRKRG